MSKAVHGWKILANCACRPNSLGGKTGTSGQFIDKMIDSSLTEIVNK